MTFRNRTALGLMCTLCIPALAGCSGGSSHVAVALPTVSEPADPVDRAFDLMLQGHEAEARKILKRFLTHDPQSATAHLLIDSMDRDPKALFGERSYRYTIRAGDTPVNLTERLLGNRLLAYQLMRYNGLRTPVILSVGQIMQIPGEAPRPAPLRSEVGARPEVRTVRAMPEEISARPPIQSTVDCDLRASRAARAGGLAALNQGNLNRSVTLLSAAAARYPCNTQIAADLARARRIAATVQAHR